MFVLLSSCRWHHMEQMKSRWKLGISLLLFGKRRLMRWQEDRLVERHFKAKSNHLHGYGEEKNLRTPLEMSFSLCFLRGKKILLIQSEKSKTCLYKLPILVILESKYLSLVSKGGEVMERNLTLTIN